MTLAELAAVAQSAAPGAYLVLFDLDTASVGGPTYRFTRNTDPTAADGKVVWRGNTYEPFDIKAEGFEVNGRGALPTPRISVSNVNRVFSALVGAYGDLLGCTLTRWRVFERFLDTRPDADPSGHFPLDVYRLERKVRHDKTLIEWELSAAMDQEGRFLPGRIVLRETCRWRYRVWTGTGFDYSAAQCPYAEAAAFDADGVATDSAHDSCGKLVADCRKRFPAPDAVLPFGGFPGVARTRVY